MFSASPLSHHSLLSYTHHSHFFFFFGTPDVIQVCDTWNIFCLFVFSLEQYCSRKTLAAKDLR